MTLARIDANGQPCVLISGENAVTPLVTAAIGRIMWMMRPSTLGVVSAAGHVSTRQP
jgi:Na+/H+ antiporter NhaB